MSVPETMNFLCENDVQELRRTLPPLSPSENYGIDLYLATVSFVENKL